jgi:AraC family transcriptional regulator, positive regulator of tynA and feaB
MEVRHFDTSEVAAHERFDLYRDGLCAAFAHLTPQPRLTAPGFQAALTLWRTDSMALTMMSTEPHHVARTRSDLALAGDDGIYLNYVAQGRFHFEQDGRRCVVKSGEMVLIDNSRPFDVDINAQARHCHFAIRLPDQFRTGALNQLHASLNDHPVAPVLKSSIHLFANTPQFAKPTAVSEHVLQGIEALMHAICLPIEHRFEAARQTTLCAERWIDKNFKQIDCSIEGLSQALKMSKRTVQAHLGQSGTHFSQLLQARRLRHAYQLLIQSSPRLTQEQVAEACGFAEVASFYRAFRREFGHTPGAIRPARR